MAQPTLQVLLENHRQTLINNSKIISMHIQALATQQHATIEELLDTLCTLADLSPTSPNPPTQHNTNLTEQENPTP